MSTAMQNSDIFHSAILDSVADHIAVIDADTNIIYTNHAWKNFAEKNDHKDSKDWTDFNYLQACDKSAASGDVFGLQAAAGIRKVINGETNSFTFEYPCHSPTEKRWFLMRTAVLNIEDGNAYVVSHTNITARKLAEKRAEQLSRIDELTNIPNRRVFNEFIENEWLRCKRKKTAISLAIIDIDYFKKINDTYGHSAGDECLKKIALLISSYAKRPTDLCARLGGEEFALVLSGTESESALEIINNLIEATINLEIKNENSLVCPYLTISVGLATTQPTDDLDKFLIHADDLLYKAKEKGRNQVVHGYFADCPDIEKVK